jgi:hypothetical protein
MKYASICGKWWVPIGVFVNALFNAIHPHMFNLSFLFNTTFNLSNSHSFPNVACFFFHYDHFELVL